MHILDNLLFSLNATMPIFFVMVIGWSLKKFGFLDETTTAKLNQLVFKFFLPALLFMDLATEDFAAIWDTGMVLFCFIVTAASIAIAIVLSAILSKNKAERGEIIQAAYRSGVATLGIVFMTNIYADASMMALIILGSVPLYNIAAVVILYITSPTNQNHSQKGLWKKTAKNVITNPIILGILFGMLWSVCKLPQPPMVIKTISYLGNIASLPDVKTKLKETLGVTTIKLILLCLVFLPIAIYLGFRNEKLVAILVMLGSATTSSSFIMAKNMGHEGKISSCAVMVTTLLSSFSMTLWLFLLRTFQLI